MKIGMLALVVGAAMATGCIVTDQRAAYEGCNAGQSCANGTICTTVGYTNVAGGTGYLCSVGCSVASSCPDYGVNSAYAPTCVVNAATGVGDCYDTCATNADCGLGTQCAVIAGTPAQICVPVAQ